MAAVYTHAPTGRKPEPESPACPVVSIEAADSEAALAAIAALLLDHAGAAGGGEVAA
jgi:hypothetical protein